MASGNQIYFLCVVVFSGDVLCVNFCGAFVAGLDGCVKCCHGEYPFGEFRGGFWRL